MSDPAATRDRPKGLGLTAMVGIMLGLTALIISLVFLALLISNISQREALVEAPKSARFLLASSRAERALIDIETGIRGAMLTGDYEELEPYYEGLAALPVERAEILDNYSAGQAEDLRRLDSKIGGFIDFSMPVANNVGRISPAQARRVVRNSKVRLDEIRREFARINSVQEVRLDEKREEASNRADRAVIVSSVSSATAIASRSSCSQ